MSLVPAFFLAAMAAASPGADVLAVERAIAQAQVKNDIATIEASLAPGYTFTLPDGKIVTRDRFVADMRTWWRPLAVENSEQQVRVIGSVAIINGKALYRWQAKGKPVEEAREQYTDTYALSDGRWQRVASHSSCLSGRCT
ncbi:MAG: nuclear transport factor 2 family protein [Sphingomonas sp.]|uniref:nuclear transport factor 2 family protein n=1 Tax=Sphingomonas sp. TaxID=28214 RepID=UPI0025EA5D99|nr:nuclear transport factor 2 family protein [Sphingomonas sp.]MBY0283593.1 nuclear transport factor 2 family protein [Sphingomonas sp.]